MADHVINSQLICADYDKRYPNVISGEGSYVIDDQGRRYLDASGCTAAVTSIGHGVTEICDAIADQARTLAVHPTHLFDSPVLQRYLTELCAFAPDGFTHAWTISGGTEAVENAIKLAFQYQRSKGRATRCLALGRWGSSHGNSLTTLDVGGFKVRRDYYVDMMVGHPHVSPCLPYRAPEGMSEGEYEDVLVREFEDVLGQHADQIACFVAEPIVGSALGAAVPTASYFSRIAALCADHDILMIADEVMTGFGRTGTNFGCEHFGTHADILACAKGITGGYFPVGAVIARDAVYETVRATGKPFFSGQTYCCTPLAAAAGLATLRYFAEHDVVARAAKTGAHDKSLFEEKLGPLPCVGEIRGKGLFLGVEFVADKETKAVIPLDAFFSKKVEARAFEKGLVTLGGRGTVDGNKGDHMLFAPPLTLDDDEAEFLASALAESVAEVWREVGAP